jgi:hypothetical protein
MKVEMELDLLPFKTPNYVLVKQEPGKREDGFKEGPKFHLKDIDSFTLEKLCDDFRREVFKKAGKQRPPQSA